MTKKETAKSKPTAKIENQNSLKQLAVNVLKFTEVKSAAFPGGSVFCVNLEGSVVFMQEFIGVLIGCQGNWQSLGMAYNPRELTDCMEIVIQYSMFADDSERFENALQQLVDSKVTIEKGVTDETESS